MPYETWSIIRNGKCRKAFCCHKKTKKCAYKGKAICRKRGEHCGWRYYKSKKHVSCKRRMCCKKGKCHYLTKKICVVPPMPFQTWSIIRKGRCRKMFKCKLNKKGEKSCKFVGKTLCKKIRRPHKPKKACYWKHIKSKKGLECRKRICCKGKKCKRMTQKKKFCTRIKKNFCRFSHKGGNCKQKYCCKKATKGKYICGFKGKKKL